MRKSWTDERMDDLNGRVDELSRRMDSGFNRVYAELRAEISSLRAELRAEISALREETKADLSAVATRIDDLHSTILQLGAGAIATFVVGFAGLIATQL